MLRSRISFTLLTLTTRPKNNSLRHFGKLKRRLLERPRMLSSFLMKASKRGCAPTIESYQFGVFRVLTSRMNLRSWDFLIAKNYSPTSTSKAMQ